MSPISIVFPILIGIAKYTWWFVSPIVLFPVVRDMWLLSRMIMHGSGLTYVLLEIKIPDEIIKTPKAMEVALSGIHGAVDIIDFREKWIKGQVQPVFSLEIVGIDGRMHFFIRCERKFQNFVEAKIYGQYPDAEIKEVDDYVKDVPHDTPNKSWDVWGTDMVLLKNHAYPIRTYEFFEDIEEERRLDPLASLAEVISKMQESEQLWVQILISPVFDFEWVKDSQRVSDRLMGRKEVPKPSLAGGTVEFIGRGVDILSGKEPEWREGEKQEDKSNFMRFSRGEQHVVEAIEDKRGKVGFKTTVRTVYVSRREVMNRTNIAALQGIFRQLADQNLNGLRIKPETKPSSSFRYLGRLRNHRRKIRIFRMYKMRMLGMLSKPYILNVEELATLFHFPGRTVRAPASAATRMGARRGEPPIGLPVE